MKDLEKLTDKILPVVKQLKRYLALIFVVLVAVIYGFLMYQVTALNSKEPSDSDIAAQSQTTKVPHVDPAVLKQIQSLQDNSVNVQSLFDAARSNPFQE